MYPDRFYVEASGFGGPASILASDSREMVYYVPGEARAYKGDPEKAMRRLFGLEMSPREWTGILLGHLARFSSSDLSVQWKGSRCELRSGDKQDPLVFIIQSKNAWVEQIVRSPNEQRIEFGEPLSTEAGLFPKSIRVISGNESLEVKFDKVEANPTLSENHLKLDLPPQVTVGDIRDADFLSN